MVFHFMIERVTAHSKANWQAIHRDCTSRPYWKGSFDFLDHLSRSQVLRKSNPLSPWAMDRALA